MIFQNSSDARKREINKNINRRGRKEQKFAFFHPKNKKVTSETRGKKKNWNRLLLKKYDK